MSAVDEPNNAGPPGGTTPTAAAVDGRSVRRAGRRRRALVVAVVTLFSANALVVAGNLLRSPSGAPGQAAGLPGQTDGSNADGSGQAENGGTLRRPGDDPSEPGATGVAGGTEPDADLDGGTPAGGGPSGDSGGTPSTAVPSPGPAGAGSAVTPSAATATTAGPDVQALMGFVERERGLTFRRPPAVVRLAPAAFEQRLTTFRRNVLLEAVRGLDEPFAALDLVRSGSRLTAEAQRFPVAVVPAFYDPKTDELVTVSQADTPFARKTFVRELTHALNDQHFELHRPALHQSADEAALAFEAVYQGIAATVEDRYVTGLPPIDRQAVAREQERVAGLSARGLSEVLIAWAGFPQSAGRRFAAAGLAAGGPARLDEVLRRPPTTTEQVLRPEEHLAGNVVPAALGAPAADGRARASGTLGRLTLATMLRQVLDGPAAEAAADGWGAARWVSWASGSRTCTRLAVVMDTPQDNAELGQALQRWVAAHGGAEVSGSGPFTLTRCA